jgi:hypothetical protein
VVPGVVVLVNTVGGVLKHTVVFVKFATGFELTNTPEVAELAEEQTPLCTTTRNKDEKATLLAVYVVNVLVISVQVAPSSSDRCHFTTEPVLPVKVNVVLLNEEGQTIVPADNVPPTEVGLTVTDVFDEAALHGAVVAVRKYVITPTGGVTVVVVLNVPEAPIVVVEMISVPPAVVPTA